MSATPKSDEVMGRWFNCQATVHDVIRVSRSLESELSESKRKIDTLKSEKLKVQAISKSLLEEAQHKLSLAEARVKELEAREPKWSPDR